MNKQSITTRNHVIVFMDIHDYSIVINLLGKKQAVDFLQEVYEKLGDIIVKHKGEIIKYMGDAILCVFPGGSECEVVKCAIELRAAYTNIVNSRNISHDTELEIGIDSGVVATGVFGHRSLMQKDVFGDEVNRAAMIGHHRGIAITEKVRNRIKMDYRTVQLPDMKAKWQKEPLKVWEVAEDR